MSAPETADFLIVGGGVAGLSAAARLCRHGRTIVLEAEDAPGYHSSGRSATFSHFGIGGEVVRALTSYSRNFFDQEQTVDGFPLSRPASAMFVATETMEASLDELERAIARFTRVQRLELSQAAALFPPLRIGRQHITAALLDVDGRRLDAHGLMQHFIRALRSCRGQLKTASPVIGIEFAKGSWVVQNRSGESFTAPVLVNAAGAWADRIAMLAGVTPLNLDVLRRTIIVLDAPAMSNIADWPFVKTVEDSFYMLPEAGKLIASPVDEVPSEPCDAQPDDYDVALAAARVEQYTHLTVDRISHRWAGLRSFVRDRVPMAGFAVDAPGFFWLAGQGGYGLQTAPALAEIAEAIITGNSWPRELTRLNVTPQAGPARLDTMLS